MDRNWECVKEDLLIHMIRCIRIFTKYYVKGKVQGIRLIGEEAYLHIECNIKGKNQVIDVDEFKHGKKNREEQRDCYFEEAVWGDFYYMNNWKELSLELCEELSHRLNVPVEYIDLEEYKSEQEFDEPGEDENEKFLQPHILYFFRPSKAENNDVEIWGKEIFNMINEVSTLSERYQIKQIKTSPTKFEQYKPDFKKFINCLEKGKNISTVEIAQDEVSSYISKFKEKINNYTVNLKDVINLNKQINKHTIIQSYEYKISFYSCLDNKNSVAYHLYLYKNKGKKIINNYQKLKIDSLKVWFLVNFNNLTMQESNEICKMFEILIKWFRPEYAYAENMEIDKKRDCYEKENFEDQPNVLGWINYFSPNIIEKIGLQKINDFCKTNKEVEFNNGILKIKKLPLNAESKEDLELLVHAENMLGLK